MNLIGKTIPYTNIFGVNYLIEFSEFKKEILPEELQINLSIIEVVITTESDLKDIKNNASTLLKISDLISEYMRSNDYIYYFYCSNAPIFRSNKNSKMNNQEFRSSLFSKMFEKSNKDNFLVNKITVIEDSIYGDHYIHLITNYKNQRIIDFISKIFKNQYSK